ncbi:MAG: hypothetical protein P1U56_07705 [Saprospiraceae bacterium]|nr:hypothetical protein [Saprospiraceae bacterium]
MAKLDNKSFFKEWLERLQQESWQLELLISGLALFGIYESQDLLIEVEMYARNNSEGFARVAQNFFINIFKVGWRIFFINLLIHVILRGLWIGAIGLRYVSQDIDYEALNYSEYFTELLKKRVGEFDDFIERLEKICSVLFAYTFLLFLLFFSLAFFLFQIILISYLASNFHGFQAASIGIFLMLYIIIGLVVFIDFITIGIFKKIKDRTVNRIYNPIFTFYGWTTLTFLYRPLLYNFLDNRYTKRLFFFSIPYILVILLFGKMFTNNNFAYYPPSTTIQQFGNAIDHMNYEDLRKNYMTEVDNDISKRRQIIPTIILNKYMNDEDYLKIFLKMSASDYKLIQRKTDIDPYWKPGFNFSLFSNNKNEDSFYKERKDSLEEEFDSLRIVRRTLRKERRALKDTLQRNVLQDEIDSINSEIEVKRAEFKAESVSYEEEKQEKIIEAFLSLTELEVDDKDIKEELDCYFFKHPNKDEKGILCLYPMDSISYGKHDLYFYKEGRKTNNNNNSNDINIKIPFYKVHSFD